MTIDERIAQLEADGFKLERQLVAGQQKLIHIQGQLVALREVRDGNLGATEEVTP